MLSLLIATICISTAFAHEHHDHDNHDMPDRRQPHHECSGHHHEIQKDDEQLRRFTLPYNNHPYDKSNQQQQPIHQVPETPDDALKSILDPIFMPSVQTTTDSVQTPQKRSLLDESETDLIRISAYYDPDSIVAALDTDTLQYVKDVVDATINYYEQFVRVVPVGDTWFFERRCAYYYTDDGHISCTSYYTDAYCQNAPVPDAHLDEDLLYDANTHTASVLPGGPGIQDTDLMIYVTYYATASCSGSTLAHAGPCAYDQYGRPVAGNINICGNFLSSPGWKPDVQTMLHEMSHITIMLTSLWDEFRDSNGDIIPEEEILGYDANIFLYIIQSPMVKSLAKAHFGCTTNAVNGVPLQSNSDGSASGHWHLKYTFAETMNPTIYGGTHYYSLFTLALMEDSGWYLVNYDYAEPYAWGKNRGCGFYRNTCINPNNGNARFPEFCTSTDDDGCNADYSAPANCYYYTGLTIPTEFQYFPSDPTAGGPEDLEYCPMRDPSGNDYESICWDDEGASVNEGSYANPTYGETWGVSSRCTNLVSTVGGSNKGYCMQHTCNSYDSVTSQYEAVTITVNGEEIICLQGEQGTVKTVSSINNRDLECPEIDIVCGTEPTYGQCYFGHFSNTEGKCICSPGYTGPSCATRDVGITSNEAVLDSYRPTMAPTAAPDRVCAQGFDSYSTAFNTEWPYNNQLWNEYGTYKHPTMERYLFWNIFRHRWIIGGSVGATSYYCYCDEVSEFAQDVSECNGKWKCWKNSAWTAYPTANTNYGSCSAVTPSPTTPSPTAGGPVCDSTPSHQKVWTGVTSFRANRDGQAYIDEALQEFLDDPANAACEGTINDVDYKYLFTYKKKRGRLTLDLIVCCGVVGAVFDNSYTPPTGYAVIGEGQAFDENDLNGVIIDDEDDGDVDAKGYGEDGIFITYEVLIFVIILFVMLVLCFGAFCAFTRWKARKNQENEANMNDVVNTPKKEDVEMTGFPETEENVDGKDGDIEIRTE